MLIKHINQLPTLADEMGEGREYRPLTWSERTATPLFMDRSAQSSAKDAVNRENQVSGEEQDDANTERSALLPGLESEFNNPQGFTPEQKNDMIVGSEQGAGGANAGVVGQAGLTAARTRNSAGYSNVLDEAARDKGRTLSDADLSISAADTQLQNQNKQTAAGELGQLYGEDTNAMLSAMGLVPGTVNAETNAGSQGWFQNLTGFMNAAANGAKGAAALGAQLP